MSAKKVTFAGKRPSQIATPNIDDWVENRETIALAPKPPEPMKRLTIDVSLKLHTRIKSQCAIQKLVMADEIRDLLEQRFPEGVGQGASS